MFRPRYDRDGFPFTADDESTLTPAGQLEAERRFIAGLSSGSPRATRGLIGMLLLVILFGAGFGGIALYSALSADDNHEPATDALGLLRPHDLSGQWAAPGGQGMDFDDACLGQVQGPYEAQPPTEHRFLTQVNPMSGPLFLDEYLVPMDESRAHTLLSRFRSHPGGGCADGSGLPQLPVRPVDLPGLPDVVASLTSHGTLPGLVERTGHQLPNVGERWTVFAETQRGLVRLNIQGGDVTSVTAITRAAIAAANR
ncbi:MAG: hypothetical protein QOJ92_1677 [Frankiales bacterium]|nr:hypothetical protein [Frankiales bacterium]